MPLKVVVSGVEKTAARASVIINGVAKAARRVEAWNGSAWKLVQSFAGPLSLSVSPEEVTGQEFSGAPAYVTSSNATATPSGGQGPYTYSWAMLTGTGFTINTPTKASTSFSGTVNSPGAKLGTARCTCTDVFGTTATADVSIILQNSELA